MPALHLQAVQALNSLLATPPVPRDSATGVGGTVALLLATGGGCR
jgi:hypothetical protein